MNEHGKISYVEFPATDLTATKQFFQSVFGWSFTDYGPDNEPAVWTDVGTSQISTLKDRYHLSRLIACAILCSGSIFHSRICCSVFQYEIAISSLPSVAETNSRQPYFSNASFFKRSAVR